MSNPERVTSPVAPGDIVAGKYRVERVLGSGGMGVVVAARHIDLDQPVALKFILPHALAGAGNVQRFMREARAAVRLKSEHVARVYDVGRDGDDRPFMVLELLEGMDLAKLHREKGSLPVADAVEYVLQACEALVEAHAAGIVHRDLKPQNIFVTRHLNGTPLVKVLDFGIAKAIGPGSAGQMSLTDSSTIIGSPLYMAPEQMRSARTADVRSDIWALGVILYELLGDQLPFEGETLTEVCVRVVNERPAPLIELRPALDVALVAIVMRCLEKEPERRFHNVSALATALEPFSRSAKQGGLVRPWRSFEDTQDSLGGGNPFAAGRNKADAGGPSSATTLSTFDEEAESADVVARSPALGSGPRSPNDVMASVGAARSDGARGTPPPPFASTDTAWGDSALKSPSGSRVPRTFSMPVVAAVVVLVAGAAVAVGLFLGRGAAAERPTNGSGASVASGPSLPPHRSAIAAESATADASAVAAESATAPASATALSVSASDLPVVTGTATGARPSASVSAAESRTARPRVTGKTPRGASRIAEPIAAPVAPPEPKAAEPVSPNGAPILR
jgi:serine/threonine-protein kinase